MGKYIRENGKWFFVFEEIVLDYLICGTIEKRIFYGRESTT